MIRAAVCEDAFVYAARLERMIAEWAGKENINIQTQIFHCGEELLADIEISGSYNLIFMDIELKGGMSGIQTAEKIRESDLDACIVFVSQYDCYYRAALKTYPFQYLEKPVDRARLFKLLDYAGKQYGYLKDSFVFRFKNITYSIRLSKVLYFASDRRIIHIYMEDGEEYQFYDKLDELEKQLEMRTCRFFRIHKSYLVNGIQIEQFRADCVVMRNKERLTISKEKRSIMADYHISLLENS